VERVVTNDGIPSEYVNEVFARINRNTAYPKAARLRQQEGRVGYRLTLSPQGELLKFEIDSSGIDSLDEAARSAIHAAAPFPKLPDLGGTVYRLSGAIVFKLG
jgi:protein TonB